MIKAKKHEKLVHCQKCGKLYVRTGMNNKYCGERNVSGCSRQAFLKRSRESEKRNYQRKYGQKVKQNRLKRFKRDIGILIADFGKQEILRIIEEVK